MAAAVESAPTDQVADQFAALLREERWDDAVHLYRRQLTREDKERAEARLAYAIALIRSGQESSGVSRINAETVAVPEARTLLRRHVIPQLVESGKFASAISILDPLIESIDHVEDRRLRGSLHGREKRWDEALADARQVAERLPDDMSAQSALMQLLIQSGRVEEAGQHAVSLGSAAASHPRSANVVLLALTRSGRMEEAADFAIQVSVGDIADELVAGAVVRALFEAERIDDAIDTGERLLRDGWDHPLLRSYLGQAYMATHRADRYDRAIEHLREGLDQNPADHRMNAAIGEALLRTREYEQALPYLDRACALKPKAAQSRALYARALKQAERYDDAAREFRQLLKMQPFSPRWQRYAAGALSQAGRKQEAAEIFDRFVGQRRKILPRRFEDGLHALWNSIDTVHIPQARLDWAWSLGNARPNDRDEWERRAKWGHLADHYLLDWLECRDKQVHEAMERLADLSDAEEVLSGIDRSHGMILASAHIGPMYAGPLALELLGVRSKWLASTPSVARTAYAKSLISTSDQTDMDVGKAFMKALRQGFSVVIAVDGAINLAAPRIQFEGQEMTYSSFAARTAHRLGVPSVFAAPRWEDDRIGFVLRRLPDPLPNESADDHAERWREAFFAALRDYLGGPPENLRLSGGLWRHIR